MKKKGSAQTAISTMTRPASKNTNKPGSSSPRVINKWLQTTQRLTSSIHSNIKRKKIKIVLEPRLNPSFNIKSSKFKLAHSRPQLISEPNPDFPIHNNPIPARMALSFPRRRLLPIISMKRITMEKDIYLKHRNKVQVNRKVKKYWNQKIHNFKALNHQIIIIINWIANQLNNSF